MSTEGAAGDRAPAGTGTDRPGHIVIAGPGRSGITVLARLPAEYGLDTGFPNRKLRSVENEVGRAGLEPMPIREAAGELPCVIKNPRLANLLPEALREGWLEVARAILPVRPLEDAVRSRYHLHCRRMLRTRRFDVPPARLAAARSEVCRPDLVRHRCAP